MQASMGALDPQPRREEGVPGAVRAAARPARHAPQRRNGEIREMLAASFGRLNAEFGFSLTQGKPLDFDRFTSELQLIESNYVQYLGLTLALRLAQPKFMEQFRRMLVSKLRVVFENASSELELWNKARLGAGGFAAARAAQGVQAAPRGAGEIQSAAGELEQRIDEIETQDQRLVELQARTARAGGEPARCTRSSQPFATDRRRPSSTCRSSTTPFRCGERRGDAAPGLSGSRRPAGRVRPPRSSTGSASTAATACPGRAARPVPRLAVGGDAAADAGRDRAGLLRSASSQRFPDVRGAGRRAARRRARAVERPRLLQPRPQPAPLRAGRSSPSTAASFRAAARRWRRCPASAARPPRRSPRSASASAWRSSTATSSACWRACSAFAGDLAEARRRARAVERGDGAAAGARRRGLHPGPDGPRRDGLPRPRAALPALPGARRLRGRGAAGTAGRYPVKSRRVARGRRDNAWLVAALARPRLAGAAAGARRLGRPVEPAGVRLDSRRCRPRPRAGRAGARRCRRSSTC